MMNKKHLSVFALITFLIFIFFSTACLGPGIITSMSNIYNDDEDPVSPEERVDFSSPYSGDFLLVNNESWNGEEIAYTGTLPSLDDRTLNEIENIVPKGLPLSAYRIDPQPDRNFVFEREHLIQTYKDLKERNIGDVQDFIVSNIKNNSYEILPATLQAEGSYCEVWVNEPSEIDTVKAEQVATEFDTVIWPQITSNFYVPSDINSDGKVAILIYDIQDNFDSTGYYIGGYFAKRDLLDVPYSNRMEIFYIDTYPSMHYPMTAPVDVSKVYSTLAHEFQHMVNFNRNCIVEEGESMSIWIDEALSLAAERLVYGPDELSGRISYYNNSTSIKNGHSLTYWDYNGDTSANYSLSYIFMQYLRIQMGSGESIYKEILEDASNDYKCIQNILNRYSNSILFGDFMTNWRIAMLLRENEGPYGFSGDPSFDSLSTQVYLGSSTFLRGGGALVTLLAEDFESSDEVDEHIQYVGIK